MSAPSKTSRLGRGSYQRPSADVLDALTDPGPAAALPVISDVPVNRGASDTPEDAKTIENSGTPGIVGPVDNQDDSGTSVTSELLGTSVVLGTSQHPMASDTPVVAGPSVTSGVRDTTVVSGTSVNASPDADTTTVVSGVPGAPDDPVTHRGISVSAVGGDTAVVSGVLGTQDHSDTSVYDGPVADALGDSDVPGNLVVSGTPGFRPKRTTSKARSTVPLDVSDNPGARGVSDDRGTPDVSGAKPAATPRDHVKVARPLVGEMRDAVWFLSEHGRPRVQLGELLDEAISAWLKTVKAEHTSGAAFPVRGRLR